MKNNYSWWMGVLLLSTVMNGAIGDPVRGKKIQAKPAASNNSYSQKSQENDFSPREVWNEKRFYLFGGIDLGYAKYSQSTVATDVAKSGLAIGVRALAAYYWKKWLVDGGLGFMFISSSGTNANNDLLKVYTRTVFLDFSPRYRFNQNWQFGPELQYWLGADNGLNADILSTAPNHALMGGLQLMYEWMDDATKYRIGARWNTDLNIPERTLNVIQAFFQIGFSPGGGNNDDRSKFREELKETDLEEVESVVMPSPAREAVVEETYVEPEPEVMSTPAPVEEAVVAPVAGPQKKMVMTLDVNSLPFTSDSAQLPKYNRDRVKEIGRFLGEQSDGWDSLIVSGHTDEQGKKAYNMKLSKARAETVRQLLGEGGAPINKIKAVGYGPTKPIAKEHNKKAWDKNRRVEFEFIGVKDGIVIQNAFKR